LAAVCPDLDAVAEEGGTAYFLVLEAENSSLQPLSRLSFVQAIFREIDGGLQLLEQNRDFVLPEELVHGVKYAGKTNELATQLAINVAIHVADFDGSGPPRLLDPMAGRGTTLLWAVRYGMDATGIEQDLRAPADLQRHVKKQSKLHRIKHSQEQGFVGPRNRQDRGRFMEFDFKGPRLRLIVGDSTDAVQLLAAKRFQMLVVDLPYGIQHRSGSGGADLLDVLGSCAPGWAASLEPGGSAVLLFNSYRPKRPELIEVFSRAGLEVQDIALPHRMSESIVRDLVAFKKP
jgi:hypothetical protein